MIEPIMDEPLPTKDTPTSAMPTGAPPPALVFTQQWQDRLLANDSGAWREMSDFAAKCARAGAWRAGAAHLADDVAGDLLLLIHTQFVRRLRVGDALRPFLVEAARRIALVNLRKYQNTRIIPVDDDNEALLEAHASPDIARASINKIDAERARERIKESVNNAAFWDATEHTPSGREQYGCGDHNLAAELRFERTLRKWTQKQMAAFLGVPLPTYISYEHACVMRPNDGIISQLRAMQRERWAV